MSFDVKAALRSGYTQEEVDEFLKKNPELKPIEKKDFDFQKAVKETHPTKQEREEKAKLEFDTEGALKAGYTQEEIDKFLKTKSVTKGASVVSSAAKNLVKGVEDVGRLTDVLGWFGESPAEKQRQLLETQLEEKLPSKDERAEQIIGRAARMLPSAAVGSATVGLGAIPTAVQLAGGTAGGQIAQEAGFGPTGQAVGEAIGAIGPDLIRAGAKGIRALGKASEETLPSGLSKPRAVESKLGKVATIESKTQEKALEKLDKEASELSKKAVQRHAPLAHEMKLGKVLDEGLKEQFEQVRKLTKSIPYEIEVSPIIKDLTEQFDKYSGVRTLPAQGKKIVNEIRAFLKNPQRKLEGLLNTYRANNDKLNEIFEASRLKGNQKRYADFLLDFNRSISSAIEKSLPEDSAWLKLFKDTNKRYSELSKAKKVIKGLESFMEGDVKLSKLEQFKKGGKEYQKLKLHGGEALADEIAQISEDLELAKSSIKKIKAKTVDETQLGKLVKIAPLGLFIPGLQIPASIGSAVSGIKWARLGLGWFLSSPSKRRAYSEALKAIRTADATLYKTAVEKLNRLYEEED